MSSDSQAPNYAYIHPSAQSTRQILESTPTTGPSSAPLNFTTTSTSSTTAAAAPGAASEDARAHARPTITQRASTTNYADADARARAAIAADQHTDIPQGDRPRDERPDTAAREQAAGSTGSIGWRPRFGRKQSWNQQDMKHELQMSVVMNEGAGRGPGFSEVLGKTAAGGE
jgi:hypothetical protein